MSDTEASSREELLGVADEVLGRVPTGTEAEVSVTESVNALSRFANGAIHQSVADRTTRVRLRILRDGRCGVSEVQLSGNGLGPSLVEAAETIRRHSPPGQPVPLLVPDGGDDTETGYSETTTGFSPEARADAVEIVCSAARERGQTAFGTCETALTGIAMVSTAGLRRHGRHTVVEMLAVSRGANGSAYAARTGSDSSRLDAAAIAAEVTDRCQLNQGADALQPGTYEVILSPYAVAEMLDYLGYMGFSGLAVAEKRSFMRFGERQMSETVTVTDDVADPALSPFPFDGEGATTVPVTLIDAGVASGVVHDSVTAQLAGVRTTGHSLPQPNTDGPLPRYLSMAAGDTDTATLIGGCRRGLLVTRFWYVGVVHPLRTILTGMTRDGTFLVENGAISRPVRDLRFTQSVVDALNDVRAVGSERLQVRGYFGATQAPWLHLGGFTFSS